MDRTRPCANELETTPHERNLTLGIADPQRQEGVVKQSAKARPVGRMWDYGDDNRGPEMAAIALVMTSLSVIAVALRCFTMITILKRFLVEDWLAVLTCVSNLRIIYARHLNPY